MTALIQDLSPEFQKELTSIRVAYSRAGCITSIVLILLGSGLDYSFYPSHLWDFFVARILIASLTFAIFLILGSSWRLKYARPLTLLWVALPQLMICWMIAATDGEYSIYFVGLTLALYAVGILVPIKYKEGIAFGLFTCLVYAAACFYNNMGLPSLSHFIGNMLFIFFSGVISVGCSYFAEISRLKIFQLKEEVSGKNQELSQINTSLLEIKGQLIQKEKMASLGTLSAGLLHEVNNPVNYSLMAAAIALRRPEVALNPQLKENLDDIQEGLERIKNIVTDLKTFAYQKPDETEHRTFPFEKSIDSALRLVGYETKQFKVDVSLPQDTHISGDEPALIGVLINLLSNACLALQKSQREHPQIEVTGWHENGRLHVSIRDNGSGIKAENISRVFEPFFTTRDVGQGLGLGLSMSYSIVQRHGGMLTVTSEENAWTEFQFDLPLAHPENPG